MSIMLDPVSKKDDDYSQLLVQNKALKSELMQCQADKDFVWSLWKRLQVSNPDVTEAISLVIQREKDKAEAKDHKVLEILQVKDNRIEELQNIVAKQALEISELLSKKVTLQEKNGKLHSEAEQLQDKLTTLELRMKGFETKERSMDDTFRRTVEESQHEKHELQRKVTALTTELEIAREEKASVSAKRLDLERTVRNLERDVSEKIPKFDGLIRELEETRMQADKAERQIHQFTQEVDFKNRELESIRKELKELWNNHNQLTEHSAQQAELIRQLQSLQHDTQIMIKNQEDAFSVESKSFQQMYSELSSRYEFSKQTETELRQESLQLKKNLMDRDDTIANLQNQIQVLREQLMRSNYGGSFLDGDLAAVDSSTLEARRDLDALRQLERTIGQLDQSFDHAEGSVEFDMSHTQKLGRHSTPGEAGQQLKNCSPLESLYQNHAMTSRGQSVETRLLDTQKLLELKCKELEAIKQAHSKRLERLRAVQNSEKLLRDQLKTYEDHQPIRKKKKLQRINPKLLQHEDSDAVWNELAYFKSQCRTLEVERLNLQEQLDELKVQAAVDGATVHELKISLQSQQEEFEYQLKKRDAAVTLKTEQESELMLLKSRLQNKDLHIGKLEKDLHELAMDRDTLLEEKKLLKNQANELQQELSKSRIHLADLRHTVQSQQHALEDSAQALAASTCGQREVPVLPEIFISNKPARNRPTHRVRKLKHTSSAVKRYQHVLDKSIERMRSMFSHFKEENLNHMPVPTTAIEDLENDSEWEEESDDNTEATAESLGMAIARQASQTSPNIKNTNSAVSVATNKLSVSDKIWHKLKKYPRKTGNKLKESQTRTNNQYLSVNRRSPADSTTSAELNPRVPDRVVLREVATSPIPWGASGQTKAKTANNRSGLKVCARQLTTLKQRIFNLQQQLTSLRESRTTGLKLIADLKENNQQLTLDLSQANHRLRSAKQTCQRLTAELERLQHEKVNTDKQLSEHDPVESSIKQNDSDRHLLEVKLKMSSSEVARQAATIRTLKTEAETLQDQIRGLQDRVNHLERDNNQKRNLLESQRIKMKAAQDAGKVHEDAMEELQTKLKLTTESLEKMRIQLESMKKRMRVVTKEKRDYEDKYLQVSLSLEKKTKELSVCREQRAELEAGVTQLESLSQQQLQRLATHSEAAVDAAQAQVTAAHTILTRYQQFVKLLATEILDRVIHSRKQLREAALQEEQTKSTQDSDVSLKRAQDTARNILNISQSDLDDIMSADGDHEAQESHSSGEDRRDKKWLRRCDKVIKSKEDFVGPLLSLILQKVDERADLMVRLTL